MDKQDGYERITITLPKELLKKFRKYCEENAINMSGRIAKFIEKDLESVIKPKVIFHTIGDPTAGYAITDKQNKQTKKKTRFELNE